MTTKLMKRKTTECFEDKLHYFEEFEEWKTDIGSFSYYYFHIPEKQVYLQVVDFSIPAENYFTCSGPPLWIADIRPIILIALPEKPARRIYGATVVNYLIGDLPEFFDRYNANPDSFFSSVYENGQTQNQNSPQMTLERLCKVHKPNLWSWEKIINLVYGNIKTARDVLLDSIKQIPNEYITGVIGDLELRKPAVERFTNLGKNEQE